MDEKVNEYQTQPANTDSNSAPGEDSLRFGAKSVDVWKIGLVGVNNNRLMHFEEEEGLSGFQDCWLFLKYW
ncbi:hypothetical protein CEXT_602021, partial [Caerostris extrusa]